VTLRPVELAERAVEAAAGDEAEAVVHSERSGLARFAGAEVHQPTLIENETVQLRIVRDGRVGVAAGNRLDDESLRALARRAAEAADKAPPDPDFPGLAQPAEPARVEGFDPDTAELGADEQAQLAASVLAVADGRYGLYGFVTSAATTLAIASTVGLRVEQTMTDASALVLAADGDASGYADNTSWRIADLDPGAVAREAVAKADRTRDAASLDPGPYRAVLEPYAIGELLQYFAFDSFNGLALLEDRSYLSGRLGEQAFDPKVSIYDDALDPAGLPKAFDFEGVPKQRVALVEDGVLRGAVWDRLTTAREGKGRESTGHAPPAALRPWGPIPFALSLAPGEATSTEELAELVGDGIYITRLHYLGIVEPRQGVITGMTRDGTFRIREGKIAEPLVNLRFTVAVPDVFADVPGLTRHRKLANQSAFYDDRYPYGTLVPAIATARFDITGTGSGPGL
jgi:PmbA protein